MPAWTATQLLLFCLFSFTLVLNTMAAQDKPIALSDGSELSVNRYPSNGKKLYIWLPGEAGLQAGEFRSAEILARKFNIETWLVDSFASHFLPVVASSLDQIPTSDITTLLTQAIKTSKEIFIVTTGDGIRPLLSGLQQWQYNEPDMQNIKGVILLSPKFYQQTPEPGQRGQLLPIVSNTNLPIYLFQPTQSPWYWKLPETVPALEKSGSDVYVHLLPQVRDRFYYRPDATEYEQNLSEKLPGLLQQAGRMLTSLPVIERKVNPPATDSDGRDTGKKERKLRPFSGNKQPPELILASLTSPQVDLQDYRGKVVLVNFWASWCPPCVHEMPSMQRLQNKLGGKPFTILAVNMAEDEKTIRTFTETKVKVNFPILLDRDGAALKRWQVFAFPTSYLIAKNGNIRYALFGSVEWDEPEQLDIILKLINE